MRTITRTWPAVAVLLALGLASAGWGSAANRATLGRKLSIRYVANPEATPTPTPEILNNANITAGTFEGSFWAASPSAELRAMQNLVKALLCAPSAGGDDTMQFYAARIAGLRTEPVLVMLLNDASPLTATSTSAWGATLDDANHVWPSAGRLESGGAWSGSIALGGYVFAHDPYFASSTAAVRGTFLHEFMHTQDMSDGRAHIWIVRAGDFRYGADRSHYAMEAIPNRASTYREGIANAVSYLYADSLMTDHFAWFAENGTLAVEKGAPPEDIPASMWLYSLIQAAHIPESPPSSHASGLSSATYAFYRIRDLPPRFIAHNESVLAMTLAEYARHISEDTFFDVLRETNYGLENVSASAFANLISNLADRATTFTWEPVEGSGEVRTDLVPIAFADYFTGQTANTPEDFAEVFEGLMPDRLVADYWEHGRERARAAAPLGPGHTPVRSDLTNIAISLGLTQCTMD